VVVAGGASGASGSSGASGAGTGDLQRRRRSREGIMHTSMCKRHGLLANGIDDTSRGSSFWWLSTLLLRRQPLSFDP
jgi:hypothetical protein